MLGRPRPNIRPTRTPTATGWTEVSDTYRAPAKATRAVVELHLMWAPGGKIEWGDVSLAEAAAPAQPQGAAGGGPLPADAARRPQTTARSIAPLIAEAARQKADLVVLGETLTYYGIGKTYAECAEPIPGPSTEYFGELAKKHNLYIVAGLLERDRHLVYNVAVLIGPDGKVVGKYRKVCLPRGEIERRHRARATSTRSSRPASARSGMMVCYDGFFPEVARELTQPRGRGDRLAGLGLQPDPGRAPGPARTTSTSSAAPTRTSRATG